MPAELMDGHIRIEPGRRIMQVMDVRGDGRKTVVPVIAINGAQEGPGIASAGAFTAPST